ncbi:MAG TPA: DUF29 family protein [Roseiarcus sp.]|jgi:hypothetical protein
MAISADWPRVQLEGVDPGAEIGSAEHLKDNPSLQTIVPQAIATAFEGAIIEAADETKLPESAFPAVCPWSFDQLMDARFWPE